jgi:hypothetical protein
MPSIGDLLHILEQTPSGYLFNPWYQRDRLHDQSPDSPVIRKRQLEAYLTDRLGSARYVLVAEALGYQGGHFTGIAMTSERILLGFQAVDGGPGPHHVFSKLQPSRTSTESLRPAGMNEPTATIVWNAIIDKGVDPFSVVLWNALAWHPYNPGKGMLSNRTPTRTELESGKKALESFLDMYAGAELLAVGRKSQAALAELGAEAKPLPHPAYGAAPAFRAALSEIMIPDRS